MILKKLSTWWDERSFRSMTPAREQTLRTRWAQICRIGSLRFILLAGLAFSAIFVVIGELLWVLLPPHRFQWSPRDMVLSVLFGFALAVEYRLVTGSKIARIERWRTAGRL